jgi:hypothetical protein
MEGWVPLCRCRTLGGRLRWMLFRSPGLAGGVKMKDDDGDGLMMLK